MKKYTILNTFIEDEDLKHEKEFLLDVYGKDYEADDDELQALASDSKDLDYFEFQDQLNFDNNKFALIGKIELWHGTKIIEPRILENENDLFNIFSGYDDIKLFETGYGKVTIELYHHDGTHNLELVQLNYNGWKRFGFNELEYIFKNSSYYKNGRIRKALGWV